MSAMATLDHNAASDPTFHAITTRWVDWHVVDLGTGPALLLLHGTGSSTHSWQDVLPRLAERYRVIAVDLPGHGDSRLLDERALTLDGMAANAGELLQALGVAPQALIGHSAGAAIAVRMVLDHAVAPVPVVSLNGAFVPFGGLLGQWFSPLARGLAGSDFVAQVIARRAHATGAVERLMGSTGSVIGESYLEGYRELFASPDHVRATLGMMANWDLWTLQSQLDALTVPLILLFGECDQTVPPSQARVTAARAPHAVCHSLGPLGHLAHEEDAASVTQILLTALSDALTNQAQDRAT